MVKLFPFGLVALAAAVAAQRLSDLAYEDMQEEALGWGHQGEEDAYKPTAKQTGYGSGWPSSGYGSSNPYLPWPSPAVCTLEIFTWTSYRPETQVQTRTRTETETSIKTHTLTTEWVTTYTSSYTSLHTLTSENVIYQLRTIIDEKIDTYSSTRTNCPKETPYAYKPRETGKYGW